MGRDFYCGTRIGSSSKSFNSHKNTSIEGPGTAAAHAKEDKRRKKKEKKRKTKRWNTCARRFKNYLIPFVGKGRRPHVYEGRARARARARAR